MNYSEDNYQRHRRFNLTQGIIASIFIHFTLVCFTLIKIFIFPSTLTTYTPSLRVDVVDLPDITKQDLDKLTAGMPQTKPLEEKNEPIEEKVKEEAPSPSPDEMVLNEKKQKTKEKQQEQKKRSEKMNQALARIKAFQKINDLHQDSEKEGTAFKGNRISKGTTQSGEERTEGEINYQDLLIAHLRKNWELPTYLARQDLKAQVLIKVDGSGRVIKMVFQKSSGNPGFDDAVRRTINMSEPFPEPSKKELIQMLTSNGFLLGFPL